MKLDREDREHIENGELILNNFQKSVDNKKEECYNEGAIVESSKNSLEEVLINKLKSMGFTHEFKPEGWYDERGKYIKDDDKIWDKIKEMNKTLTSYKAIKGLELKDGDFIKTTTLKIKRFVEVKEGKIKNI